MTDDENELEGLEKSFEAGVKLARGHRRVCLECFAPEGTPIQVSLPAAPWSTTRCFQGCRYLCLLHVFLHGLLFALVTKQTEAVSFLRTRTTRVTDPLRLIGWHRYG